MCWNDALGDKLWTSLTWQKDAKSTTWNLKLVILAAFLQLELKKTEPYIRDDHVATLALKLPSFFTYVGLPILYCCGFVVKTLVALVNIPKINRITSLSIFMLHSQCWPIPNICSELRPPWPIRNHPSLAPPTVQPRLLGMNAGSQVAIRSGSLHWWGMDNTSYWSTPNFCRVNRYH